MSLREINEGGRDAHRSRQDSGGTERMMAADVDYELSPRARRVGQVVLALLALAVVLSLVWGAQPTSVPETDTTPVASDDRTLLQLALRVSWGEASESDQASMCYAWDADRELTLETYLSGGPNITNLPDSTHRQVVADFYDGVCG